MSENHTQDVHPAPLKHYVYPFTTIPHPEYYFVFNNISNALFYLPLFSSNLSLSLISLNASSPGARITGTAAVNIANTPNPAANPKPPGAATAPYSYESSSANAANGDDRMVVVMVAAVTVAIFDNFSILLFDAVACRDDDVWTTGLLGATNADVDEAHRRVSRGVIFMVVNANGGSYCNV